MRGRLSLKLPAALWLVATLTLSGSGMSLPNEITPTSEAEVLTEENSWPMAGANIERTSWTPEEVRGDLEPVWYKIFEPYLLPRVQVIAANGLLYISTSKGLYALDADTGSEAWVFPTELPLGNSPTIQDGVAYVGGYDRNLYALDALTGRLLWSFRAGAGFDTNPLVVGGKVYAGSRDGVFYAIHAQGPNTGKLAWKYQTGGPIHFSAAYSNGTIYFASNDSHAYALNAISGRLVWKSEKLPGAGFHSWWPVVYEDYVIFSGSRNIRGGSYTRGRSYILEEDVVYPNKRKDPNGTPIGPLGNARGDWVAGTPTIDMSKPNITENGSTTPVTEYFEQYPWRRTYFVLNRSTGEEYRTDFDKDGKPEYAPILWFGTASGNRYPPVVGSDGVLYQANNYLSNPSIPRGHISGWQVGTPYISIVAGGSNATDEPVAYAAGGDLIYWNRCCDRVGASFDISVPYEPGSRKDPRSSSYFGYNLPDILPGYNERYYNPDSNYHKTYASFGGRNGIYGFHGDVNPPIPYRGRVYMHRSNAVIAFGKAAGEPIRLPDAKSLPIQNVGALLPPEEIRARLEKEVTAILEAGHLRPGYSDTGGFDRRANETCGDYLTDYWHHPGDIIYTLIRALPHLPPGLQQETKEYLQDEFENYPPYAFNHIGWSEGAAREHYELPPEIEAALKKETPKSQVSGFAGWRFAPHSFYAAWKYAEVFGGAREIFDAARKNLESPPADSLLQEMPHVHNAYIAGYIGYLELEKLAGYPESSKVRADLNHLLQLRVSSFSTQPPDSYFEDFSKLYCRTLNVSRNYMYLVPELGAYLHDQAFDKMADAVGEFESVAPLWFVSKSETTFGEGVTAALYDYYSLFQAKAMILKEPYEELVKYLDVPSMAVGDLFYIDNLTALLEACSVDASPACE